MAPVIEREIAFQELTKASEVFLTSSTRDISAVSAIDKMDFSMAPGEVTQNMQKKFAELIESNLDP